VPKGNPKTNLIHQRLVRWQRHMIDGCHTEVWRMTPKGFVAYEKHVFDYLNMRRPDLANYENYLSRG
jgi:hypothetical protein